MGFAESELFAYVNLSKTFLSFKGSRPELSYGCISAPIAAKSAISWPTEAKWEVIPRSHFTGKDTDVHS